MPLPRLRFNIAYNGAGFSGWQSQPDNSAIQDHFRKALETVLRIKDPWMVAASRTDAGVHAEMQIAAVDVPDPCPDLLKLQRSLNALLPDNVGIRSIVVADPGFHPVYGAVAKVYRYRLWTGGWDNPFLRDFAWRIRELRDGAALIENLDSLCGTHDFSSFCAADSSAKTRERTIIDAQIEMSGELVNVWIQGSGFLKQMVRNIVGTLVDLDLGKLDPAKDMTAILSVRDRTLAGRTAPARGLALVHIDFDQITSLHEVISRTGTGFKVAL